MSHKQLSNWLLVPLCGRELISGAVIIDNTHEFGGEPITASFLSQYGFYLHLDTVFPLEEHKGLDAWSWKLVKLIIPLPPRKQEFHISASKQEASNLPQKLCSVKLIFNSTHRFIVGKIHVQENSSLLFDLNLC